ncbi:SMP-30/gluconolactonase/LRE family protein [Nocardia sp. NBC_01503]|uniref:SMP-30/gluconolactonase/LRE family protein n=1 Tax=Nocardia sp. NBC_01503 TaxID=2975997 RepID=UPI002E7B9F4C|nr:SMP-30/gluconolactonase/LRE family protein [Nocardia sp. NBC_01503]WTL35544.1 SMP-30/gluconolactonase/LRE family protein [Nocardia sp. NBC_01503]
MRIRKALVGGLATAQLGAGAVLGVPGMATAAPDSTSCGNWAKAAVASGFGSLENLAFDGRGGLLLSEISLTGSGGGLRRLAADGARELAAPVESPGGIVINGSNAYVNSGNTFASGVSNSPDGKIVSVDLATGAMTTVVSGLHMPNGLAQLPDGGFVVSRDLGPDAVLTRVAADGSGAHSLAPEFTLTNGVAYDPARRKLFVSTTFDATTTIGAIDIDHPDAAPQRITLPGFGPLNSADDLTVGPDGAVYVALNAAGRVVRVEPDTGAWCTIADGLPFVTSVRFGAGPGWDPNSLYATGFLGTVTRLTR